MERAEVDAVPVLWAEGPAPLSAGLVFGVGRRDESFLHGGLTHLVEHLVMASLGRSTLDANASVDLTVTEFSATGRPDRVVEFLRRVCEALACLPLERLAVEAHVLRAEDGHVQPPVVGALLAERYGASGAGLAGFRDPALLALTGEQVREWASTYFVRGNAALWLSGPPPAGLALPLPEGSAPSRRPQRVRDLVVPALVEVPGEGTVVLGADLDRSPGLGPALRVLRDRVEDELRHRRGLTYTVEADQVLVEGVRRFAVVLADVRDGQEAVAARAIWQGLSRLADAGPDEAELAHDLEGVTDYLADPRSAVDEARAAASGLVAGTPAQSSAELRAQAAALTADQVRDAAAQLRSRALLGVPEGVDVGVAGFAPVRQWSPEVLPGRAYRRRRVRSDAPRGAELRVGDDGVSVVLAPGEQLTVRYADAVGLVEIDDGEWSLVGVDGSAVPLAARDWRDGRDALARVRAAVPDELQTRGDLLVPAGRSVLLVHAPPLAAAEALWPAKRDAWVVATEAWTLVWREEDPGEAYADAAGVSAALGGRGAVLQLVLEHGELSMVVLERGKERDRHVWTGDQHDPSVLAGVLHAEPEVAAALLAHRGGPADVLEALVQRLAVPGQVGALLSGVPPYDVPGLVHEPARGLRESVAAAVRGEYDPPDSDALHHRLTRWQRQRPPAYRATHAALFAGQAGVAGWLAARADGDWTSWTGALAAFFGAGALTSLWDVRPPGGPTEQHPAREATEPRR